MQIDQPPIQVLPLFPLLDKKLIELLRSLTPDDWNKPTVTKLWTVKDVAAHLLDTNIRSLSASRDHYTGETPPPIKSDQDLIDYLNRLNNDWVKAMRRVSPKIITDWLEETGPAFYEKFDSLDLFADAVFPVSWAGDKRSPNWFHIAREYTEKWHHQQQIRDAVNKQGILTKELYYPCLDTFMRALPHTYRNVTAPTGTIIQVTITGEAGGDWYLVRHEKWELKKESPGAPVSKTTIQGDVAWKLFSKSWRRDDVAGYVEIEGDQSLGNVVLDMISVVA